MVYTYEYYLPGTSIPFACSDRRTYKNLQKLLDEYGDVQGIFHQAIYGTLVLSPVEFEIVRRYNDVGESDIIADYDN